MGLEGLISNDLFYYGVYGITLGMVSVIGCAIVHIIDLKSSRYSSYQLEGEGRKHYEKRLSNMGIGY